MISWKHTFKRLNEEYEIAQKKKKALDNLYTSGKISQSTCDSFTVEITNAINDIEKQRHELAEKMNSRTQDLEGQLKTLEMLLANYEIQHVVGEIDEDIYNREINLLTTSLETTRNELCVMKDAINQIFPPQPIADQVTSEPVSLSPEAVVEAASPDVPVETPTIEPAIMMEPESTMPDSIESPVIETATEMMPEASPEEAPTENCEAEIECSCETATEEASTDLPVETSIEEAPAEEPQIEIIPDEASNEFAPLEESIETTVEASLENAEVPAENPIEEAKVEEAPLEMPVEEVQAEEASSETPNTQLEDAVFETPIETETFEASITEETPLEELQAAQIEPENQDLDESTTEAAETEPADEEETLTIDNSPPEEQPVAEAPDEIVTATEEVIVEETAEPVDDVPLHTFNVTEHEPLETTLEKVIEPTSEEHVIEPVILGEANIQAHPLEAPHQAPTEDMTEADADQTSPEEENEEDTTE